jgi:HSP20 family protein
MIFRRIGEWPTWDWRSPTGELERMRREMDRLAEGLSGGVLKQPAAGVFPLINVTEDIDNFYVRAELPGVKSDDLNISVTGNGLAIEGERKFDVADENAKYHRKEREAGKFSRMFNLPTQVDTTRVDAHAADGVLTIVLPKAESAKPKQITVKSS